MLKRLIVTLMLAQFVSAVGASTAGAAADAKSEGPLTIARQGSLFVGGREVKSDELSTIPQFAAQGTVMVDQMYVRYQMPLHPKPYAITLIHGCCLTGKS